MSVSPEYSFGFLLHDIARLLRKRYDRRARALGLSRAQWQVLAHLHRHEGIHQQGLAEVLEIEGVTLGRLVQKLEEAGWIERRPDPSDRRARRLHTTSKVAPVLERMWELGETTRKEALAGLGDEERQHLMEALLKVRSNISEREARETTGAAEMTAERPRRLRHG